MLGMTTLTDDMQMVKAKVAEGEMTAAATLVAGYAALKPSLARQAKARMPALVFNHHPRFRALGSRLIEWPEPERKAWAETIERDAGNPTRLPGHVDQAAAAAEDALA